jgi:hypothetical protein
VGSTLARHRLVPAAVQINRLTTCNVLVFDHADAR